MTCGTRNASQEILSLVLMCSPHGTAWSGPADLQYVASWFSNKYLINTFVTSSTLTAKHPNKEKTTKRRWCAIVDIPAFGFTYTATAKKHEPRMHLVSRNSLVCQVYILSVSTEPSNQGAMNPIKPSNQGANDLIKPRSHESRQTKEPKIQWNHQTKEPTIQSNHWTKEPTIQSNHRTKEPAIQSNHQAKEPMIQ